MDGNDPGPPFAAEMRFASIVVTRSAAPVRSAEPNALDLGELVDLAPGIIAFLASWALHVDKWRSTAQQNIRDEKLPWLTLIDISVYESRRSMKDANFLYDYRPERVSRNN